MSVYDERPWLGLYGDQAADKQLEYGNALEMFRAGVAADPDGAAVKYFDGVLTRAELDEQSDALASALLANGFGRVTGSRSTCRTCRSSSSAWSAPGRPAG